MALLEAKNLSKSFGGLIAVKNYSLSLPEQSIYGLIGPNGAGKTTVINLLTGISKPDSGKIMFNGTEITNRDADEIAKLGIARTFQNLRLFKKMTVKENILVASQLRGSYNIMHAFLWSQAFQVDERKNNEETMRLMSLFHLENYADHLPGELPYGVQKRLEVARALALNPKVLLLDEPASGMTVHEANQLVEIIRKIRDERKISILLVEHRVPMVMALCDIVQVMNQGEVIAEGPPDKVRRDAAVLKVYLKGGAA